MYKKVLVPVSGKLHCERSMKAVDKAIKLCDGEIVLLHVTEPVAQTVGGEARADIEREDASQGLMAIGPILQALEGSKVPFHTRVISGTPAETILGVALEEKADLIVMFTDGRDTLADLFFGSITERVLRDASVDLLAVRQ